MIPALLALSLLLPFQAQDKQAPDKKLPPVEEVVLPWSKKQKKQLKKRYFLMGPVRETKAPKKGHGLLVILPGGPGDEGFKTYCRWIHKICAGPEFLAMQPVAIHWRPDPSIIWPMKHHKVEGKLENWEDILMQMLEDVRKRRKIDPKRIYLMGWSSSGPLVYRMAHTKKTPFAGFYIVMSVYKPKFLPKPKRTKGRAILIEHSPTDEKCPYPLAQKAEKALKKAGAKVRLQTYQGGHIWPDPKWMMIKRALKWLEEN